MVNKRKFSRNTVLIMSLLVSLIVGSAVLLGAGRISATNYGGSSKALVSSDVAQHLAKERNISIKEAHKRVEWQDEASALEGRLIEELPEQDFGGVWVNKENDRVQVGVLNGSAQHGSSVDILDSNIQARGLSGAVDFIPVGNSYGDLENIKEWITRGVQEVLSEDDWPVQVGITTDTNQVMVHIPSDDDKISSGLATFIRDIEHKYANAVRFETYSEPAVREGCNWWFCDSPLRGAVGLKGSDWGYGNGIYCTAGFNVVGNSGTKYVLTAGHCAPGGSGWATETFNYTTKKIGPIHRNEYRHNGIDAMIIKIRENTYNWNVRGWVYARGGLGLNGYSGPSTNYQYDINGTGTSGSLVGARICISGAISSAHEGGSCGAVHEVDINFTAGGTTTRKVMRAGYCSRGGDSGAPVFRNGKALGIHTGANTGYPVCSNYKYYTGINPIIREMDDTISVF